MRISAIPSHGSHDLIRTNRSIFVVVALSREVVRNVAYGVGSIVSPGLEISNNVPSSSAVCTIPLRPVNPAADYGTSFVGNLKRGFRGSSEMAEAVCSDYSRTRFSGDCAPKQSATSCEREQGVHNKVEKE